MRTSVRGVVLAAAVAALSMTGVAAAQEAPNYEQLRKQHDDAQRELRAAQERKNQLSAENEELRRQIAAGKGELDELRRADADAAERSYFLRAHYAAWKSFASLRPEILAQWRAHLQNDVLLAPTDPADVMDPDWPTSVWRPAPRQRLPATPTTAPATSPATVPVTNPATAPEATRPSAVPATTAPATTAPATSPATLSATLPG